MEKPLSLPASRQGELNRISENGLEVLRRRYLRKGLDGKPAETVQGMFWRVASHVALPERAYGHETEYQTAAERFYDLLTELRFFPNSPTFTGAGTPLGQLAACFVLAIDDDMGKDSAEGIFNTLRNAALIQQTGGGNGFSFSRLRPKSDPVNSSAGVASGPVGFLRVYDAAFGEIAQGGSRRGANMAVLRIDHPDIEEFIACKAQEGQIPNFNISVGVTDAFMQAVQSDADFDLVSPRTGKVARTVRARDLFGKIIHYAHRNGEPGMLFLDAANRSNPVPHLYELEATNPCGEQWLGP
ncbi:MAG: ribonucleotide reductase N-terminal alpha domain-containing protein [Anaerolineae bacterium]